jgi:integrase
VVVSATSRNARCPCGSGRKFKRCCAELADTAARTARVHAAVGKRIQAWAGEHHRDALDAAWAEITGGREDAALGEVDVQLIAAWIFNDRELPGGGTAAERYSRLDDLERCQSLTTKTITPHVLRHTAAMRLLHAGIDTTVIALWLEQVETTQMYIHADLALKERALARTKPLDSKPGRYRPPDALLGFLDGL